MTNPMVIPNAPRPQPQHPPQRYQHAEKVRDEKHALGADAKVPLDVPEAEGRHDGADGLRDAEVGDLEEGEGNLVGLDDGDEGSCLISLFSHSVGEREARRGGIPVVFNPSASRKYTTKYKNVCGRARTSRRAIHSCLRPIVA